MGFLGWWRANASAKVWSGLSKASPYVTTLVGGVAGFLFGGLPGAFIGGGGGLTVGLVAGKAFEFQKKRAEKTANIEIEKTIPESTWNLIKKTEENTKKLVNEIEQNLEPKGGIISKNAWRSVINVETVLGSVTTSYKHTYKITENASTIIQTKIGEVNEELIEKVEEEIKGIEEGKVGERLLSYEVIEKLNKAKEINEGEGKREKFVEALSLMEKNYGNVNNFLNTTKEELQDLKKLINESSQFLQQTINRIIIYGRPVDYAPVYEIIGGRVHFKVSGLTALLKKHKVHTLSKLIEKLNEYVKTHIQPDLERITQEEDLQKIKKELEKLIPNLETALGLNSKKINETEDLIKRSENVRVGEKIDIHDVSKIENITLQKLIQSYVDIVYKDENSIKGLVTKIKENLEKNNLEGIKENLKLLKKRVTLRLNIGDVGTIEKNEYWLDNWFDTARKFINEYLHDEKFLDLTPEQQLEKLKINLNEGIQIREPEGIKMKNSDVIIVNVKGDVFEDFLNGCIYFSKKIEEKLQEINEQRKKEKENIIKTLNKAAEKTNYTLKYLNKNTETLDDEIENLNTHRTELKVLQETKEKINESNSDKLNNLIEIYITTESKFYYSLIEFIFELKKKLFTHKQSFWNNFNIDNKDSVTKQVFIVHKKLIKPLKKENEARKESQRIAERAWNIIQELHKGTKQFLSTENKK